MKTLLFTLALVGAAGAARAATSPSTYAADASVGVGSPNQPDGVLPAEQPYLRFVPPTSVLAVTPPAQLLSGDPPRPRVLNTYVVTTDADTGNASLRAMIAAANASAGLDQISFNIPGGGVRSIKPTTQLPTITDPVVIDGTTQPGFVAAPLIEIDGSLIANANGLYITAGNTTIRGLIINRFKSTGGAGFGILIDVGSGNTIEGNWVGINSAGTAAAGNAGNGIAIFGTSGANIVGGLTPQASNLVSGNGSTGIACATGNVGGNIIRGNWVGLNAAGTAVVANSGNGIFTNAPNCIIGGTLAGSRNIVSGSTLPNVFIGTAANATTIQGNWIGTDATGTLDFGSVQNGINLDHVSNTIIGGNTTAARNVIAGNEFPNIYVLGPSTNTKIQGNYLGTDVTGTIALGDGNAVVIDKSSNNQLGGPNPGEGNLISGQMPNTAVVILNAGATGNTVRGNRIGTNAAGTAAIPNFKGILVNGAANNVIGGTTPGDRNLISGNETYGIEFRGANNSRASGNYIGTDVTGTLDLGNKLHGVVVIASADTIGGTGQEYANWIAFNGRTGVYDSTGTGNLIRFNKLWENKALGIDLYPRGIVANDTLDGDTGANSGQNFPTWDSTSVLSGTTKIYGHLLGKVSTGYTLDFYASAAPDTAHFGEGKEYLGTLTAFTNAQGRLDFVFDPGLLIPDDLFMAATATDGFGNTSEFSPTLCLADHDKDGIPDCYETAGWPVDANSDGIYDLDLQALGADPNYVDIFVEIDAMSGYWPPPAAVAMVQQAFANLPASYLNAAPNVQGVRLWPQFSDTSLAVQDFPGDYWPQFQAVKKSMFGTTAERFSGNSRWLLEAKRMFYRYGLWGRTVGPWTDGIDPTFSGTAEGFEGDGGDDFMITFGSTGPNGWNHTRDVRNHAGTFMHELGHTLGLRHGGVDHIRYKPNYYSVMNYTWQTPKTWQKAGTWRLDYSRAALPTLNEANLDENAGLGAPPGVWPPTAMPFTDPFGFDAWAMLSPGAKADWTQNNNYSEVGQAVDLNLIGEPPNVTSPNESLVGSDDWANLVVNFRRSANYKPLGASLKSLPTRGTEAANPGELTPEINNRLDRIPPPKPKGVFVMDGKRDPNSMLIGSNAGLNFYAALQPGGLGTQLYFAVDGATAGRDQVVFVSKTPGALRAAPLGKAGQVAGWAALLDRAGTAPASEWRDDTDTPFEQIVTDSAGTFLEGVVHLDLLLGEQATSCAVALASYASGAGGALLGQVPAGDGDGDLEVGEWITLSTSNVGVPGAFVTPGSGAIALSNALPNPARGPAYVRLTLPRAADVAVTVHDVAGRTVATLARGPMTAGTHELVWNHADSEGRRTPPGVYFIVARSAGEMRSTRVVVLD